MPVSLKKNVCPPLCSMLKSGSLPLLSVKKERIQRLPLQSEIPVV